MTTVVVQNCSNVGFPAIKALLSAGCKVRTQSRNPEQLKESKLSGLEVEVFTTGDDAIFDGADRFICIAPAPEVADDRIRLAIEFMQKAQAAGIKHGSVLSVALVDEGNVRGLFGHQFNEIEEAARALEGVSTSFVRAPFFMENLFGAVATINSHDAFYDAVDADVKQLLVHADDVGEALCKAALDTATAGKAYFAFGANISKGEIATLFSEKLERKISFVKASDDDARKALAGFGLPAWSVEGCLELNYLGVSQDFVDAHKVEYEELVGRPALTAKEFIDTILSTALGQKEKELALPDNTIVKEGWIQKENHTVLHGLSERYAKLLRSGHLELYSNETETKPILIMSLEGARVDAPLVKRRGHALRLDLTSQAGTRRSEYHHFVLQFKDDKDLNEWKHAILDYVGPQDTSRYPQEAQQHSVAVGA